MPSQLTKAEVERIAELARLELSPEDTALFARQLTAILDYAATVQQVDTSGVEATGTAPGLTPWRADDPGASIGRDAALAGAPDAPPDAGLFRVPKVI